MSKPLNWRTEKRKISDLVPYEHNPRVLTPDKEELLKKSLEKFNLAEIPAINTDNTIIAGHQRLHVMVALGRGGEEIDVRVPSRKLSKAELKEYNVTSNVSIGEWDREALEQAFADIDLEALGLNVEDIPMPETQLPEEERSFDDIPPKKPVTNPGDVYELVSKQKQLTHRVVCGDSTDAGAVKTLWGRGKSILMVTDPPYGVNYDPKWRDEAAKKGKLSYSLRSLGEVKGDSRADWTSALRHFPGNVIYLWHGATKAIDTAKSLKEAGFDIISQIIWAKPVFAISRGDYHWKHEPCWYAVKKGKKHNWQGSRRESTLWEIGRSEMNTGHSTQKPLECMERPIRNNTDQGEGVYDPFLGSGTTLIASEKTGRQFFGLELDEGYCDVIIRRYIKYMEDNDLAFSLKRNNELINKTKRNAYKA